MIIKLSHTIFYINDYEKAYDFYVNTLGLEVRTDVLLGSGIRWLTIGSKEQQELEIILMPINTILEAEKDSNSKMLEMMNNPLKKGALGIGMFETLNIDATYLELKSKGVDFVKPPEEKFYGMEAIFKDSFGNLFGLVEKKKIV